MISQQAITDYLNRPLADSANIKKYTEEQLDQLINQLNPKPVFNKSPRYYQKATFLLCLKYGRYLPLLDMGLGKSFIALNLFRYKRIENNWKMLVTVPNRGNLSTWRNQVLEHTPEFSITIVDGNGEIERWDQVNNTKDILVITYQGLVSLLTDTVKQKRSKKGKWLINRNKVSDFIQQFQFCCFDESTAFGNHLSLTYKICRDISWKAQFALAMTGTPFGNDPHSLWPMFHVIDGGETFGEMGMFRQALFKPVKNYWTGFDEWKFDKRKKEILSRIMRHRSIRYSKDECLDLPPKIYIKRPVDFTTEQKQTYNKLIERLIDNKDDLDLINSTYVLMRSVTAGYLAVKNKGEAEFDENPKLDALIADLKEIPENEKVIISHYYLRSGEIIEKALKKEKIKYVTCNSQSSAEKSQELFLNDKSVRVMLSSTAGAMGNNWMVAHYMLFFETSSDPKMRQQFEDRIYRLGQNEKVIYYDYFLKSSIDEKILESLVEGKNLFNSVVDPQTFLLDKTPKN